MKCGLLTNGCRHRAITWGAVCLLLVVAGCRQTEVAGPEATAEPAKPITKTADRGAVRLSVTANKDRISIAERVELTIEVVAENGISVEMPAFGAQMNEFQIRDFRTEPAEQVDENHRRWRQFYDLDIFLSGEYAVPAITITYQDRRNAVDDQDTEVPTAELSTDPFNIEVASLLEGEFNPEEFHDVKDVVALPRDVTWLWVWIVAGGAGALIVLITIIVILVRRARRRPERMVTIPAHEWAFEQLRLLVDEDLIEQERVKEFYYRLNEITRTYIELRFGLMAPERTTEEFLEELRQTGVLGSKYNSLLSEFLKACDMVKYALYEPGTEEIENVFNSARDFIDQTKFSAGNEQQEVAA